MSVEDRLTPAQADALSSLAEALRQTRWALIGATAVKVRVELPRTTADLDCAVASSTGNVDEGLAGSGWTPDPRTDHKWRLGRASVDVLQADDDDLFRGYVSMQEGVRMSVVGFDLVFRHSEDLPLRDTEIPVASLPVLVLLKMISWLERPYDRTRDLGDIAAMLEQALADDAECRFDATHPVGSAGLDFDDQAPFFVGWTLGGIIETAHLAWVKRFLDRVRDPESEGFSLMLMATAVADDTRERRLRSMLESFERGLELGTRDAERTAGADGVPPPVRPREFAWFTTDAKQALLHDAIDRRRVVRFVYQGHPRVVEPHVLGTKNGRVQLQARQIGGSSSRGPAIPPTRPQDGWKRFTVANIHELEVAEEGFVVAPRIWQRHSRFDRYYAVVHQR